MTYIHEYYVHVRIPNYACTHTPAQATVPFAVYTIALTVVVGVLGDLTAAGNDFAKSVGARGVFRVLSSGFGIFKVCESLCSDIPSPRDCPRC